MNPCSLFAVSDALASSALITPRRRSDFNASCAGRYSMTNLCPCSIIGLWLTIACGIALVLYPTRNRPSGVTGEAPVGVQDCCSLRLFPNLPVRMSCDSCVESFSGIYRGAPFRAFHFPIECCLRSHQGSSHAINNPGVVRRYQKSAC
jgi:hypothetical protein